MAIFAPMLYRLRQFLNRPLAEDFSVRNHLPLSMQAGGYVFLFVCLLNGSFQSVSDMGVVAVLSLGVTGTILVANVGIPNLWPAFYEEDRWTVGRHILHTLFVLFCITGSNQLVLGLLNVGRPSFGQMYLLVTVIGFFPIMLGVFVAEQRRLKRNLTRAQTINNQLAQRPESLLVPTPVHGADTSVAGQPEPILLTSDSGRERLSLQPAQLLCVESVGNYVDVFWLNTGEPHQRTMQKTVLRSTLKDVADMLAAYPQFLRCHRAFLVNLNAVSQTEGNARGYQLTLSGLESKVPVSRSYLASFDTRMAGLV